MVNSITVLSAKVAVSAVLKKPTFAPLAMEQLI
jgi:hypothetical protein